MPAPNLKRLAHRMRIRAGNGGRRPPPVPRDYPSDFFLVHINKTGGSSVAKALGAPKVHLSGPEALSYFGADDWRRRFTFSFVRDPWAKVASHYHFRLHTNVTGLADGHLGFNDWVCRAYGDHDPRYYNNPLMFAPQTEWLFDDDDRLLVDFVGRFERLEADFEEVCRRLGRQGELPHLRRSANSDRPYREQYNERAKTVVAHAFASDIAEWGYSFDA